MANNDSYPYFNKEEIEFLEKNGYSVLNWFAWKDKQPKIYKNNSKLYPYEVGIEGTAMDVDGDWGWCRTWKLVETLEEAIKLK
jgi:hypothetical protein